MDDMYVKLLSDRPELYSLLAGWAHDYWFAERGIEKFKVELEYKKRISSVPPMSWISYCGGVPCGMVSLKEKEIAPELNFTPWLSALYILPEYRRRGIAKKLINSVLDFARESGYNTIYLFTDNKNREYLTDFYSRLGWDFRCDALDSGGHKVKILSKTIFHKSN